MDLCFRSTHNPTAKGQAHMQWEAQARSSDWSCTVYQILHWQLVWSFQHVHHVVVKIIQNRHYYLYVELGERGSQRSHRVTGKPRARPCVPVPVLHTFYGLIWSCHTSYSWMMILPPTRHPSFNPEILFYCIHGFCLKHFLLNSTHVVHLTGHALGCQKDVKLYKENLIGDL